MAKGDKTKKFTCETLVCYRMPRASSRSSDSASDPNEWFSDRFPEQAAQYGAPFMEGSYIDADGLRRIIPAYLNEDFFAAIIGGQKELGHQVVYYPSENQWYFFDYKVDAFCATTEAKLKLLLSNFLVRCSQEMSGLVDMTNLMVKFRQDDVLQKIVTKAKAVLEADRLFFEGNTGHKRIIDGKLIDPADPPVHEQFIKYAIVPEPKGAITVRDCYHKYYRYCRENKMSAPTRTEFQMLVSDAIRAAFNIGLRHDVPGSNGKQTNGWVGITYRRDTELTTMGCN